jgi:YbbR domain-containing protein
VKIQRVKEVELRLDVTYGGGATEANTTITIEPATIRLSGGEAVMEELGDAIILGKINLAEVTKAEDMTFTISLPEGVTNLTGVTEANVSISFTGLSTKEFVIDRIQMVNIPEGMNAELITERLTVVVRGPALQISTITEEDISVVVDLTEAEADTATFKATIVFSEEFETVGALGTYSVSATVNTK